MLYQKKILLIFLSHCCFSFTGMEGAAAAAATTTSVSRQTTVQQALDALYGRFAGNSERVDLVVQHILDYYQPRVIRFELRLIPGTLTITIDGNRTQQYAISIGPYSLFEPSLYRWDFDGRLRLEVGVVRMMNKYAYISETLLISMDQDGNVTGWHETTPRFLPLSHHPNAFGSRITGCTYDIQGAATARALLQEFKRRIALSAATSSSSSARSLPESSVSASQSPTLVRKTRYCSCWW